MATSKFFEVLPLLKDGSTQVGLCVMGPIGTGDNIVWVRAWAWQQNGSELAASSGNAGEHVPGAHPLKPAQMPPFAAPKPLWMVQTKLEPLSADFSTEKPAFVQAFALIENGGAQDIIQWSQAVAVKEPGHHGNGYEHDEQGEHDEHDHNG
jgi:hypothetical protein